MKLPLFAIKNDWGADLAARSFTLLGFTTFAYGLV